MDASPALSPIGHRQTPPDRGLVQSGIAPPGTTDVSSSRATQRPPLSAEDLARPWPLIAGDLRAASARNDASAIADALREAETCPNWARRLLAGDVAFARQKLNRLIDADNAIANLLAGFALVRIPLEELNRSRGLGGNDLPEKDRPLRLYFVDDRASANGVPTERAPLHTTQQVADRLDGFLREYASDVPAALVEELTVTLVGLRRGLIVDQDEDQAANEDDGAAIATTAVNTSRDAPPSVASEVQELTATPHSQRPQRPTHRSERSPLEQLADNDSFPAVVAAAGPAAPAPPAASRVVAPAAVVATPDVSPVHYPAARSQSHTGTVTPRGGDSPLPLEVAPIPAPRPVPAAALLVAARSPPPATVATPRRVPLVPISQSEADRVTAAAREAATAAPPRGTIAEAEETEVRLRAAVGVEERSERAVLWQRLLEIKSERVASIVRYFGDTNGQRDDARAAPYNAAFRGVAGFGGGGSSGLLTPFGVAEDFAAFIDRRVMVAVELTHALYQLQDREAAHRADLVAERRGEARHLLAIASTLRRAYEASHRFADALAAEEDEERTAIETTEHGRAAEIHAELRLVHAVARGAVRAAADRKQATDALLRDHARLARAFEAEHARVLREGWEAARFGLSWSGVIDQCSPQRSRSGPSALGSSWPNAAKPRHPDWSAAPSTRHATPDVSTVRPSVHGDSPPPRAGPLPQPPRHSAPGTRTPSAAGSEPTALELLSESV